MGFRNRRPAIGAAVAVIAAAVGIRLHFQSSENPANAPRLATIERIEAAPLCPWREPERDLAAFFPGCSSWKTRIAILSGRRAELTHRLGRLPTAEEHALHVHQVASAEGVPVGCVIVRRVKGESGAIELVLAVRPDGRIQGLRLQRLREPEPVANALQDERWLDSFRDKRAGDRLRPGDDLAPVPPTAESTARAIAEGVRSLLIELAVAEESRIGRPSAHADHSKPGQGN